MVALALAIAAQAAAGPSFVVPLIRSSRPGFPGWLAGPLAELSWTPDPATFSALVLAMGGCYLVVLACARALPRRSALAGPLPPRPDLAGALPRRSDLTDALPLRPALAAVVALHGVFLLAPPLLSLDVFGYIDYARLAVVHGLDPYSHGAAAARLDPAFPYVGWHRLPSPYGPPFTVLSYALVPLGVAGGLWALKATAAAASLGCAGLVFACARRLGRPPLAAALFVVLNPLWLVFAVGGAHNDLLMMLLVLAGTFFALSGRERLGSAGLVAAAGVKASGGLALPFMVAGARRRRRALAGALAAVLVLGAISFASFGADALDFLAVLFGQQPHVYAHSVPSRLLGVGGVTQGVRLALAAGTAATVAVLLVRAWHGADWITAAGWATLVVLLTTGFLMPWYVAWLLPLAALSSSDRLRFGALALTAFVLLERLPVLHANL